MEHHHGQCDHHHPKTITPNRAFAIGTLLNLLFVIVEFAFGVAANSMSLIADAGHNLSDVFSLLLAWGAFYLASKPPTLYRTYGLQRATILATLVSSILLMIAMGIITWEAIERFHRQTPVDSAVMMIVASIGTVINTATALLFLRGQANDLNMRGAYLHMAADAGVSLGVVVAGLGIWTLDWHWIDPFVSLTVVVIVVMNTWSLLKDSLVLALDAVPSHIDPIEVRQFLESQTGVVSVHDLHIWGLSTTTTSLTAHLVTDDVNALAHRVPQLTQHIEHTFQIAHSTLQVEPENSNACEQSCESSR